MATPAITPAAPASAAAAPVTSAPAVASTPSTPVSTSPAAATEALTPEASVAAMVAAAEQKGFKDGQTPEPVKVETPAVQADPATPQDPAEAAEATTTTDEPSFSFDEDGFIGAKDLAAKIDADPALKAAIPAELRNEILANARIAEELAPYRDLFASPAEAKIVAETAQEYAGFNEAFNLIASDIGKGTDAVVRKLIEAGAVRNPDGSVKKDANGKPVTNGIAGKFFEQIFKNRLNSAIVKKVEALGDDNVTAALDLVMESVGLRPSTAGKTQDQDPALAARKAELDAQEARIRTERETSTKEARQQYETALETEMTSVWETNRKSMLDSATGLDAFTRTAVEAQLDKAVRKAVKSNVAYQMQKDRITAMPMSAERRQKEVALQQAFLRENLARIAKPIFLEAGVKVSAKQAERTASQAARADAARSEVNGGRSGVSSPAIATNPQAQQDQVIQALTAKLGRAPDASEINIEMMLGAARAKGYAA